MSDLHKRILESTGFDGDDGAADPAVHAALRSHRGGEVDRYAVYAALAGTRVLAPVVAVLGESEAAGANESGVALRRDKDSDMALVTLTARGGAKAVPVFTSTAGLAEWAAAAGLSDARPVPVHVEKAAAATLQEAADTLLLDVGTDRQFAVSGVALRAFADGRVPLPPDADPEVIGALTAAMRSVLELAAVLDSARIAAAPTGAVLELGFAGGTDPAALTEPLRALAEAVSADPLLRDRLGDGLSITLAAGAA